MGACTNGVSEKSHNSMKEPFSGEKMSICLALRTAQEKAGWFTQQIVHKVELILACKYQL